MAGKSFRRDVGTKLPGAFWPDAHFSSAGGPACEWSTGAAGLFFAHRAVIADPWQEFLLVAFTVGILSPFLFLAVADPMKTPAVSMMRQLADDPNAPVTNAILSAEAVQVDKLAKQEIVALPTVVHTIPCPLSDISPSKSVLSCDYGPSRLCSCART
jgi:hypothetical protein